MVAPTPTFTASAKGQRYSSCIVRSSNMISNALSGTRNDLTNVCRVCRRYNISSLSPIHLLLISNKMLDRSDDSLLLNSLDSLACTDTLQRWVCSKAFPVASALWLSTDRTNRRTKPDVDAFTTSFLSNCYTTFIHQLLVESCAGCDSIWEYGDIVGKSNAIGSVVETELREANAVS